MPSRLITSILFFFLSGHVLFAQTGLQAVSGEVMLSSAALSQYHIYMPTEDCQNGVDDDGDGFIDCGDSDCQVLENGGFESVPTDTAPNSYLTFPKYPDFLGSWAAVNIDGEVFYESVSRPAFEGHRYASLLQNSGANPHQPWNETTWQAGGYDRFLFIANTFPNSEYRMTFYHAADNRYGYLGDKTLVQVQSMDTDYYYDTLITTPGFFDWTLADLNFTTDPETNSVAILFSTVSPNNSSVLVDGLKFCGARVPLVVANDDDVSVLVNTSINIDVLSNDENLPSEGLTLQVLPSNEALNGITTVNADGTITYVPNNDFVGTDQFVYEICNTNGEIEQCSTAWVHIEVYEIISYSIDTFHLTIQEDQFSQMCASYFEVSSNVTSTTVCADGQFGHCEENVYPCVDYYPNEDYNGMDTICVIQCDEIACDTSIFVIEVVPVNDGPVAVNDLVTTQENEAVVFEVLTNDFDMDSPLDISGVSILDEPQHGEVILGPGSEITYVPSEGYAGLDTFVYLVCDNGQPSLCDWAEVVIAVHPPSDTSWSLIYEDTELLFCADTSMGNAVEAIVQVDYYYTESDPPDWILMNEPCSVYVPESDYNGMDTIWTVTCLLDQCDTSVHIIQILPINDPPLAGDDVSQTGISNSVIINVVVNDGDLHDGGAIDPSSVEILSGPSNGEAVSQGDGTILYLPDVDFIGTDLLTYLVCDLGTPLPALCDTAVVSIHVGDGEQIRCMIPESFSPNGDGLYDIFNVECADYYPQIMVYIYDRFGNQMYQSEPGYPNKWDGTSMKNHKPLRDGTYYWIVRFNDGYTKDRAGHVLLWR